MEPKQRFQQLLKQRKLTMLELASTLDTVAQAAKAVGYSRQYYYKVRDRYSAEGESGLEERSRAPRFRPSMATKEETRVVMDFVLEHPDYGYSRISGELRLAKGILITEGKTRGIFVRHGLTRFQDRLRFLEREQEAQGFPLSHEQIEMLSRLSERVSHKHITAPYTGYLLCQDTFYVGQMKGVGKIYLQSVIDCANSFAFAHLYTSKDAITTAHMLQNFVLPFYFAKGAPVNNILTDNGREYQGNQAHPYEVLLQLFSIQHRFTRVRSPQTNGFAERFHKTLLTEFFMVSFRKKHYLTLNDLQNDLDQFMIKYNFRRAHLGYRTKGRTPNETFIANSTQLKLPMKIAA